MRWQESTKHCKILIKPKTFVNQKINDPPNTGFFRNDIFMYSILDVITDFQEGQDKLDISALGIVSADFGGAFTPEIKNGNTLLKDTRTGFEVHLSGTHTLTQSDFVFKS